jgi:hypothetical protein
MTSMPSTTYSSPFPIVFICDSTNRNQQIPEYDPSRVASATSTCISVRTVSEVDGEVTAFLEEALSLEVQRDAIEVYSGRVDAPGGRIALVDSEDTKLLESGFVGTRPRVRVFVDDDMHPTTVWVEARPT